MNEHYTLIHHCFNKSNKLSIFWSQMAHFSACWAGFHDHLIQLKFNPKYFMQNNTYFRQFNQQNK